MPLVDDHWMHLERPSWRGVQDRPPSYRHYPSHLSVPELRLAERHLGVKEYPSRVNGLLIGECPGPNTHPAMPLFPWPDASSAGRLLSMSGLTPAQYLGGLYRRNLCDEREWDDADAEERAREMLTALFDLDDDLLVVLCGMKVSEHFTPQPRFWQPFKLISGQTTVTIPHPSGLNRIYNQVSARKATRLWIRQAALGRPS